MSGILPHSPAPGESFLDDPNNLYPFKMSGAWREFMSWNKYTQIASRALRQALNETDRVAAEKRAQIGVRYQLWQNGQGGENTYVVPPKKDSPGLPPV